MARANVRISVEKVLDLLRKKQAELQKQSDEYQANVSKWEKAVQAWEKRVVSGISKSAKPYEVGVSQPAYGENRGKTVVTLTYVLDKKADSKPASPDYVSTHTIQEIDRTIKLLELTDDEQVSASVYRNIADLL